MRKCSARWGRLQNVDFLQHFPFLCEASLGVTFLTPEDDLGSRFLGVVKLSLAIVFLEALTDFKKPRKEVVGHHSCLISSSKMFHLHIKSAGA